ncbi:hypothetical protein EWM64_g7627 [Hericium alpestre]|uniref:Glycosyltransferase family 8 protein n=1 Tax=Hericium alpestre TaxID=135208 RepID=A0A4Y9ZQS7_9AGAM|nr:hypothetical protein EWM64_g7627 [Hericium alpestre]
MSRYNFKYLPLPTGDWPSPPSSWRIDVRSRQTWLYLALSVVGIANVFLGWKWWHGLPLTPLDSYQILKDDFRLACPTNPNSTAIVTTLYNDLYTLPVLTLGYSLSTHYDNTTSSEYPSLPTPRRLLLYIPHRISPLTLCLARAVGWEPHPVDFIAPPHNGEGIGLRFGDQYTKLSLWTLDQIGIQKLVYLDGDTLVRRRFDELFALPFDFAAVPDIWENERGFALGFNAGVLLLRPSTAVFENLLAHMEDAVYPPGEAEQAYLNLYFGAEAVRLPYIYNANLVAKIRSPKLWNFMSRSDALRIVHYTTPKPFPFYAPPVGTENGGTREWLQKARETVRRQVQKAKKAKGGLFREEIGWWEDAWRGMERDRSEEMEKCKREVAGGEHTSARRHAGSSMSRSWGPDLAEFAKLHVV